jgi:UDP-N-acetylglucosamine--N-acetylmuramyl-(pentapeptide) pyrophosphoryl-undecaprenol N-acetylglucosamine transferase
MRRKENPVVFFAGGGTSGHINPALAIADRLRAVYPAARIVFCGTASGLESDIVPRSGYDFEVIRASGFPRRLNRRLLRAFQDYFAGKRRSLELLRRYRPDVVVGTGGYVCGPVLAAAKQAGIPILIHEQNAFPGQSNRLMSRGADAVCISYPQTAAYFARAKKVVVTGNPVRAEFWQLDPLSARAELGIEPDRNLLLATGGSRGARTINRATVEFVRLNPGLKARVLLVCGKELAEETRRAAADLPPERLEIHEYLYDMPLYMAAADLLICRAGAITCAEVAALGKAAVFVPYPYAAADHQTYNARAFTDRGAGLLCPDAELTGAWLSDRVPELLLNDEKRRKINAEVRMMAKPAAVDDIFRELEALLPER